MNLYDYDAYGRIEETIVEGIVNPYAFTGRERDAESGLYYYRARVYDPETGRFLQQDPIGFAAGDANLYRYVFSNPVNLTDPDGEIPLPLIGATIGAGLDIAGQLSGGTAFSDLDIGSIGRSALAGALGGGIGNLTKGLSLGGQLLANALGGAAVGGGIQAGRNFFNGCRLGEGVAAAAAISASTSALGTGFGQGLAGGLNSITKSLANRGIQNLGPGAKNFMQNLAGTASNPSGIISGANAAGTAAGTIVSNLPIGQ